MTATPSIGDKQWKCLADLVPSEASNPTGGKVERF